MDAEEKLHEMIMAELKELKRDVKSLLALKYQVLGASTIVSIVVAVTWQLLIR